MDEKWNVQRKKGYLKVHVAVNIKTKEILAIEVIDKKVHDSRMLRKLVNRILDNSSEPNIVKIKFVLAYELHDSNTNFTYLDEKRIRPGIKVRMSKSIVSIRNNRLRNKKVMLKKEHLLKWKKKKKLWI